MKKIFWIKIQAGVSKIPGSKIEAGFLSGKCAITKILIFIYFSSAAPKKLHFRVRIKKKIRNRIPNQTSWTGTVAAGTSWRAFARPASWRCSDAATLSACARAVAPSTWNRFWEWIIERFFSLLLTNRILINKCLFRMWIIFYRIILMAKFGWIFGRVWSNFLN